MVWVRYSLSLRSFLVVRHARAIDVGYKTMRFWRI
jgi:hypothetical protein